jgi:hypothetical protein
MEESKTVSTNNNMYQEQPISSGWFFFYSVIAILLAIIIITIIVQLSWNASMPKIFNLPEIDAVTAFALYILVAVLFARF